MNTMNTATALVAAAGLALLLPSLTGCPCECDDPCTVTEQAYATDEQTPLGTSAEEMVAEIAAQDDATMTYEGDGSTVAAAIELVRLVGDVRFFDQEPKDGVDADQCQDFIQVDAEVSFATDDGAFDEALTGQLHRGAADIEQWLSFSTYERDLAYDELQGSYEVTELDPGDCETLEFGWHVEFAAEGSTGSVGYTCIREVGTTDDGETIMSASGYEVGSW